MRNTRYISLFLFLIFTHLTPLAYGQCDDNDFSFTPMSSGSVLGIQVFDLDCNDNIEVTYDSPGFITAYKWFLETAVSDTVVSLTSILQNPVAGTYTLQINFIDIDAMPPIEDSCSVSFMVNVENTIIADLAIRPRGSLTEEISNICLGDTVVLWSVPNNFGDGTDYIFTLPDGSQLISDDGAEVFIPDMLGVNVFDLEVIAPNGCTATAETSLEVSETPEASNITIPLCNDDETFEDFDLNEINEDEIAIGDVSISFHANGELASSDSNPILTPIDISSSDILFARVENDNNSECYSIAMVNFQINLNPVPTLTADNNILNCNDNDVIITADSGFNTYSWSSSGGILSGNNDTQQTLTVNATGNYNVSLTVTDTDNCSGAVMLDEDIIADFTAPQFGNTPITTTPSGVTEVGCVNPIIQLMANASTSNNNLSYQWQKDNIPIGDNSDELTVTTAGEYSIIVTNLDTGCPTDAASIIITDAMDQPVTVTSVDYNCSNNTAAIIGNTSTAGSGASYIWTPTNGGVIDGDPSQEDIIVTSTGTYILTIIDGDCMATSDPVNITNLSAPDTTDSTLKECPDPITGMAEYDLTSANINSESGTSTTYYENSNLTSQITNPENYESSGGTVYGNVEFDDNECASTAEITLILQDIQIESDLYTTYFGDICNPQTITVAPPNNPYNYNYIWSSTPADKVLPGGECTALNIDQENIQFSLEISDDSGCSKTVSFPALNFSAVSPNANVYRFANTNTLFCNINNFDSYQWGKEHKDTLCAEPMIGETFPDVVIQDLDTDTYYYWVMVTDSICTTKIYLNGENNSPFGKLEQDPNIEYGNLALQVNPNPNNGAFELTITGDEVRDLDVHLYDALGRMIYHQKAPKIAGLETYYIAPPNLTQGLYFVRVTGNDDILLTKKIMVK